MEMAVAPTATWIPEDDLVLKNAVEEGASLEALAKGAVQFSRRFTFQQLKDRWHALLYDPVISVQASVRMGELEGSSSSLSSKFNRADKAKENKMVHVKRKVGSIRKQYYAMRKRIRNELINSSDLGFLTEPNLHNCTGNGGNFHEQVTVNGVPPVGNPILGDCMPNHSGLQETDFDTLRHAFPQAVTEITATNAVANVGDACHSEGPNSSADNQISTIARINHLDGFPEDVSSLKVQDPLRIDGTESFQQNNDCKDILHSLEDSSVGLGKCSGVENIDTSQPFSGGKPFESNDSETKPLPAFDSTNNSLQNVYPEYGSGSFHGMGFSPPQPSVPIWQTMVDISAPDMPVNASPENKRQGAVSELPDNDDSKTESSSRHDVIHSGPMLTGKQNSDGFINQTAMSDGEFADLPDSLLDFSNEDGTIFMDVDGKDTMDKSCCDNTLQLTSPEDVDKGNVPKVQPKTMVVSNTAVATTGGSCAGESEVITSRLEAVCGDQQSVSHSGVKITSTSVLYSKSLERSDKNIYCALNTEDTEIPCNDDIFLLIHPAASFPTSARSSLTTNVIDTVCCANEKDTGQGLNLIKKEDPAQSFKPALMVGAYALPKTGRDHAIVGCSVKSEFPDASCMAMASRHNAIGDPTQCRSRHTTPSYAVEGNLENNIKKVEFGVVDTRGTFRELPLHAEAGSVEISHPEMVVNFSTSDQEEPDSDNDTPYFSDIEAMILEMDLGSYNEDSYFSRRVSKYQQYEDSKRTIIRLEQCAQSSLQRAMASQGALAILYGRHLKQFIRKTEVILGRSTEEVDVDIDLGKEGRANKISRRQAIIKMQEDGSFYLKNVGKSSISVNGKAVGNGQLLALTSSCLIEIRGMSFVFEVSHKSVKRYLDNIAKKNQGRRTNVE